jgi:Ca-activated chloride channel homolog
MKGKTVCALAGVGMFLTGVSVYAVTPEGGIGAAAARSVSDEGARRETEDADPPEVENAPAEQRLERFSSGDTLRVDARLGHEELGLNPGAETFVLVEVTGSGDAAVAVRPRVHLALVLDRSGSMIGQRMKNAKGAAVAAVERLNEGDTVSVTAFDTRVQRVVSPTVITGPSRAEIVQKIDDIQLGGDTCISCGIEAAMSDLQASAGAVDQVLLLSDGQANHGIVTLPELRAMGARARDMGSSITTVGVDLDYNEEILGALALESNGRHHFVRSEADLPAVFEKEATLLTKTVAADATCVIELQPGFELDRVVDRAFERSGNQVRIPLGSFAQNESKTVLLAVRATSRALGDVSQVAGVQVQYRDIGKASEEAVGGELAVRRLERPTAPIDPEVETRLQRTDTADALRRANEFFRKGEIGRARQTIQQEQQKLQETAARAKTKARPLAIKGLEDDFDSQQRALESAGDGFAADPFAPGAPPPARSPAIKGNLESELPFRR